MANPALLAIKPLVKAIGKQATKLLNKEISKAGISKGLKSLSTGNISSLDVVNITRSAIDKRIAPSVAKSLGISTKELNNITKGLYITENRKQAVKGRNYIKNVNRFTDKPHTTISEYTKNELNRQNIKSTQNKLKPKVEITENTETTSKRNALKLLEGKLKKINSSLMLPRSIFDNIEKISIDMIFEVLEYLEIDFFYTSNNSEPDNPIYLDNTHKGFKLGLEENDFIDMIENMLINGYHSIPVNGIY